MRLEGKQNNLPDGATTITRNIRVVDVLRIKAFFSRQGRKISIKAMVKPEMKEEAGS